MKKRSNDFYCGIVCLAFSLIYLLGCSQIGDSKVKNTFPPNAIPILFGCMLLVLSVVLVLSNLKPNETQENSSYTQEEIEKQKALNRRAKIRVAITFADFFLAWFLMDTAGFVISVFVFLSILLFILVPKEKRSLPIILILSAVVTLIVYLLFLHVFHLVLPRGVLGTFLG